MSAPTVTLLLVRHGLTELTGGNLTGRAPGVHLDDRGRAQAKDVAARLAGLDLAAVVSSPMERCRETVAAITDAAGAGETVVDERFTECDYGDWTGRRLAELAEEPLWRVVQAHPAAARFPGGESLADMAHRAVAGVRSWNAWLLDRSGDADTGSTARTLVYLVCSHGDVIKAIVADALGLHLDQFQRIQVAPGSLSAIHYTDTRPFVQRLNDVGGSVAGLVPDPGDASAAPDDAAIGGGGGGSQAGESPR